MSLRAPQKKDEKGFTIIEVMIVLALGGLIILIVFLAIPALQRNSRNTQRRNDAARVSGLIAEYVTNNNGRVPAGVGTGANQIDIGVDDLSYYDAVGFTDNSAADITDADTLEIRTSVACENNTLNAAAGNRAYSVAFAVETSSNAPQAQCV